MTEIELVEHHVTAHVPSLSNPTERIEVPLTIRVDPLTGRTSRLITGTRLSPEERPDLSGLTARTGFCPFCADTIESATGMFEPRIAPDGRIRRGSAVIVPNVMAYSEYSSVGVYDTGRHFIDLPELTPTIVGDLLAAFVEYTRAIHGIRPLWSSVNANYLPPSGSSLVHPHAQSAHDDFGTSRQRRIVEASTAWAGARSFWDALVDREQGGPRWVARRGRVAVLTPFAPVGFHEVWLVVSGCRDITELTGDDCADLGASLSRVLGAYHGLNLTSFNWAMYGAGPAPTDRYSTLLRVVSRSNAEPLYRSDVTYFEKLHDEAMIDLTPEELAEVLRPRFA